MNSIYTVYTFVVLTATQIGFCWFNIITDRRAAIICGCIIQLCMHEVENVLPFVRAVLFLAVFCLILRTIQINITIDRPAIITPTTVPSPIVAAVEIKMIYACIRLYSAFYDFQNKHETNKSVLVSNTVLAYLKSVRLLVCVHN